MGDDIKKAHWLRLMCTESVGAITFKHLIAKFKDAKIALDQLPNFTNGLGRSKSLKIPTIEWALDYLKKAEKAGVYLVASYEKEYPKNLLTINDYPPILHVKCKKEFIENNRFNESMIAVVGARNASIQGVSFASKLSLELSKNNFIVISGMAIGIDSAAHKSSIKNGTVAVVANGVDVVYPAENKMLYNEIIANNGAIVSQELLGVQPRPNAFSYRNRIVSGISIGVVVIEAALKSGSLITAKYAAEQGRDVFAVPGHPYDVRAEGTNNLIRNGATLIENAWQVIEQVNTYKKVNVELFTNNEIQEEVEEFVDIEGLKKDLMNHLSSSPVTISDILEALRCMNKFVSISSLQTAIAQLELAGVILIDGNTITLF